MKLVSSLKLIESTFKTVLTSGLCCVPTLSLPGD